MNKHTPTPWNFEGRAVYSQTEGEDICIVDSGNRKVDVANAAHIVRCVNSHDALVKALKWAEQSVSRGSNLHAEILNALAAAGAQQNHLDKQFKEPLSMLNKLSVKS